MTFLRSYSKTYSIPRLRKKVMVVCSFVSNNENRSYATYTLDVFMENIQSFMFHGRLNLEDPNFKDESNILEIVSDGSGIYFPQFHVIDTYNSNDRRISKAMGFT